jgi:hypothetical protein
LFEEEASPTQGFKEPINFSNCNAWTIIYDQAMEGIFSARHGLYFSRIISLEVICGGPVIGSGIPTFRNEKGLKMIVLLSEVAKPGIVPQCLHYLGKVSRISLSWL